VKRVLATLVLGTITYVECVGVAIQDENLTSNTLDQIAIINTYVPEDHRAEALRHYSDVMLGKGMCFDGTPWQHIYALSLRGKNGTLLFRVLPGEEKT
jgi:hypothetical protein